MGIYAGALLENLKNFFNKQKQNHTTVIQWCSQEQALPRQRAIEKRPKRWLVEVAGSKGLECCPRVLPFDLIYWMVSWARPPKVSATKRTNATPAARHSER